MRASGLKRLLGCLTAFSLLGKLAYSYDLGAWTLLEGFMAPRAHPNLLLWNVTRFHPFYAACEVLIGVAAVRLVMTERVDDEGKPLATPAPAPGSALLPLAGLLAVTVARAAGWLTLNDPLTRGLLFIPLFTLLIMRLHRHTAAAPADGKPAGLAGVLAHPALTYLGAISFPIFIVHGALGQLFYKKIIATKLWGAVMPHSFFPAYCLIVLAAAAALNHLFVVRCAGCCCKRARMSLAASFFLWQGAARLRLCARHVADALRLRSRVHTGPSTFTQENKAVQEASAKVTKQLSAAFSG
jgi:hypothetical protein